jgi:hypothetical protein
MLNDVQFGHLIKILWHDGIGMSALCQKVGAQPVYLAIAGRRNSRD